MAENPNPLSPLSASASDPVALGWMQGAPPPQDKLILYSDAGHLRFPQSRWAFAHSRRFGPTSSIWRGDKGPSTLPKALRDDIDAVPFAVLGTGENLTWAQSLDANYTDAIVVLHKGSVVYATYKGVMTPHTPHVAMSVTKSFFGLIGEWLVTEGAIDETALVPVYIPELKDSAFGDANVRQVLDMTTGVKYSENYTDPNAEIWNHARAGGLLPRPPGYDGPASFYAFLKGLTKEGEHGQAFAYKTVNTDVLGWIIRRVTGQSLGDILSQRIWQKIGAQENADMVIDSEGTEFAGGGLNPVVKDLARFGETLRCDGFFNGQQIVPKMVIDRIRQGADKADFAKAGYATLPGWSYRAMWWVSHNEHGAYMARGIHGQSIYIDPKAEMVIARFGSHPMAGNVYNDPVTLPAFHALAKHLMA